MVKFFLDIFYCTREKRPTVERLLRLRNYEQSGLIYRDLGVKLAINTTQRIYISD